MTAVHQGSGIQVVESKYRLECSVGLGLYRLNDIDLFLVFDEGNAPIQMTFES